MACGTDRGYQRHRYHGEPPCPECREAHRQSTRAWRHGQPHGTVIPDTYQAIDTPSGWLCIGCWHLFAARAIASHERACLYPHHTQNSPTVNAGTSHNRYGTVNA